MIYVTKDMRIYKEEIGPVSIVRAKNFDEVFTVNDHEFGNGVVFSPETETLDELFQ